MRGSVRRFTPRQADRIAVDELDAAIGMTERELDALRRARAVLGASLESASGRCDRHTAAAPCPPGATIWSRWCRACGHIVRLCGAHGGGDGLAAANGAMRDHVRDVHGREQQKGNQ
jgi:hypothetical protein